jgi:DNA-binding response OmpR family regulator
LVRLNGQSVALTLIETSLLRHLYTQPNRSCNAGDLAAAMCAVEQDEGKAERAGGKTTARLATYMNHLRVKLGPAAHHLQQDGARYWLVD